MTFRKLEQNTSKLDDASNLYGELKTVGRENLFNYLSSIGKVTGLRNNIELGGSATVDNTEGEYVLSTTANGSDDIIFGTELRGRYSPGEVAEAGIGVRTEGRPTGNQEWKVGPFEDMNGYYIGEDSEGYFLARLNGGNETKVRQENWNKDTLDGSDDRNNPSGLNLDMDEGHVVRFDYAWYGHGEVKARLVMNEPSMESGQGNENSQSVITVHSFYPKNEVSVEQANLPVRADLSNNGTAESFDLFIAGRQFTVLGTGKQADRINGETRFGQSIDGTWTPLISFQRETGFDNIPVNIDAFSVSTDNTIEYAIILGDQGNLNNASYSKATHTRDSESAVEVDTSADGFSTIGERRFVDFAATGGRGNSTASEEAGLDFSLPEGQIVTLAARAPGGSASVDSVLRWQEGF